MCTDYGVAKKEYGEKMAAKIHQRMVELEAAELVDMLIQYSVGRCHPLKGDRQGQYAMDLLHPYRLVFEQNGKNIMLIRIIAIEDYH